MASARVTRRQGLKLAGAAVLGRPALVRAQERRVLRIIAPFPAGGNADVFARLIGQRIESKLNLTVIVESKPGAGTLIGTDYVVRSPPDGLTLLLTSASLLTLPLAKKSSLKFDVVKDLAPVALPVTLPLVIYTTPSAPYRTLPEMIAWAKAHPGQLNVGISGIGSVSHLGWEQLRLMGGFPATVIPYAGGGPIAQALLSNVIPVAVDGTATSAALVADGKLRIIASLPGRRPKTLPDIPTVAEQGFAGYDIENWQGILVPGETPKPVIQQLQDAINEAVVFPEVSARCEQLGMEVVAANAESFSRTIAKGLVTLAQIAKEANIKFE
jgi:tripartite-type tricarboxylate transporter receptor subunit TctC